jgi:hypothetical protein
VATRHEGADSQSLGDVLERLDSFNACATIYVADPRPHAGTAVLISDDGSAPEGFSYLLEVSIAREVLEVWSAWRGQRAPPREEAVSAVVCYLEHDTYLPVRAHDAP